LRELHGAQGKGDGPGSDYASDLTDDLRTELNTEGVLFYKILNGRIKYGKGPTEDMPAFQGKLEKDQVWLLVEYLKVLRTSRKQEDSTARRRTAGVLIGFASAPASAFPR
jgi:mono/diheme cytochrome c family protein